MPDQARWDLLVIGGGAAGFFAAISCAETCPGSRVLILEKSAQVLGKVRISGGGRCNVTHACFDPATFAKHYPRGSKTLIGPLHRWGAADTVDWFQNRGVELKTEADGRMFPTTDDSRTIIDCLVNAAKQAGVAIKTSTGVRSITTQTEQSPHFTLTTDQDNQINARAVLLATGGTRLAAGARLAESLGHELIPNVPSLFAFNIDDPRLTGLPGISVVNATVSLEGMKLQADGPLLITHQGLSGPGILKLSAWGARELHERDYKFKVTINWLPDADISSRLQEIRKLWGKRKVHSRSPFETLPKRLWQRLCHAANIPEECTWSHLGKEQTTQLSSQLASCEFLVSGKSMNKDEFVTCGGVQLKDVNMKSMESKITPGLYFAGEILDIDGVTGGFNFQNAWTTGHLAGTSVAGLACL